MLIVTIDEKEYLRLGLLLEQLFPGRTIQVTTIVMNPKGTARYNEFSRVEEYARAAVFLMALLTPNLAFAQNCALCYTQAAGSSSRMIHALKSGILILMIPPMCICIGLTVMAYKKRNHFNDDFDQN